MIFRWSIWGLNKTNSIELLKYSILSFKKQFGESHEYVVYSDEPGVIEQNLNGIANVINFNITSKNEYNIESNATWMKWCPTARLDLNQTEFYIDSDVFLLKYPKEIDEFLRNPKLKFGIMDEFCGESWQHGSMQRKAANDTPFVNAGFFIQKEGYSISEELLEQFDWWKKNIPEDEQTHHDEQGALAIVLTKYLRRRELYILPKGKYMIIGPNENNNIHNLEHVTLFHAVYPDHPAFHRFKKYLNIVLALF